MRQRYLRLAEHDIILRLEDQAHLLTTYGFIATQGSRFVTQTNKKTGGKIIIVTHPVVMIRAIDPTGNHDPAIREFVAREVFRYVDDPILYKLHDFILQQEGRGGTRAYEAGAGSLKGVKRYLAGERYAQLLRQRKDTALKIATIKRKHSKQ